MSSNRQFYQFKPLNVGRFVVWGLFTLLLCVAPLVFTSSLSHTILSQMGVAIIVCLSYNILLGQGGMLSFGHAVYSGMGSFLAIHTLNSVSNGQLPLPVSLIPIVGGVASMLVAVLMGWVTTKKSGTTFAMITLGVGELIWAMSLMFPEFFGGEGGVSGNRVAGSKAFGITYGPQIQLYYLIAVYTLVCTALMFAFTRTPLGRMLNAVRDNPERVEFVGYDTQKIRYFSFIVAAFFAGISGGLAALNFAPFTGELSAAQLEQSQPSQQNKTSPKPAVQAFGVQPSTQETHLRAKRRVELQVVQHFNHGRRTKQHGHGRDGQCQIADPKFSQMSKQGNPKVHHDERGHTARRIHHHEQENQP